MSRLSASFAGLLRTRQPVRAKDYAPKFCRTRRCTLRFGHDGNCTGAPTAVITPFHGRDGRRGVARVRYVPQRSPKATTAEQMAATRRNPRVRKGTRS